MDYKAVRSKSRVGSVSASLEEVRKTLNTPSDYDSKSLHVRTQKFALSVRFTRVINAVIVASAVQMGWQAQGKDGPDETISESFFTCVFALEMTLKVYAFRLGYFKDLWNWLDFSITWSSIIYTWFMPAFDVRSSGRNNPIGAFRLFRMFRILKLMKAIPELRMVVEGLVGSLRALFWVVMLLLIVVYAFAIFFVDIVGSDQDTYPGYNDTEAGIKGDRVFAEFNNFEYFGNVQRSMMTLMSISLLAEWDAIRPVWEFQPFVIPAFITLIFAASFGVVNVIIGVICEHTQISMEEMRAESKDREELIHMKTIKAIAGHVWEADSDQSGRISRDELRSMGKDAELLDYLEKMDLPKGFTIDDVFTLVNSSGDPEITHAGFVNSMHRLSFGSDFQKTCTLMHGLNEIKAMQLDLFQRQRDYLDERLATIGEDVRAVRLVLGDGGARTRKPLSVDDCELVDVGNAEHMLPRCSPLPLMMPVGDQASLSQIPSQATPRDPPAAAPNPLGPSRIAAPDDAEASAARRKESSPPAVPNEPQSYVLAAGGVQARISSKERLASGSTHATVRTPAETSRGQQPEEDSTACEKEQLDVRHGIMRNMDI